MPTRKQRRRRQKDRRHEYEYVYVDDDGREVEVEDEPAPAKGGKDAGKVTKASGRSPAKGKQKVGWGRKVDPPSWNRVVKRGVIFAPVMAIVLYLLRPSNMTTPGLIVQVFVLLLFFLPFSFMMDMFMYRMYRKRIGDPIPPRGRKPRAPKP